MSRAPQIKISGARVLARKSLHTTGATALRPFPAWIDASERGVAFHATTVIPRVRDALVLRLVRRVSQAGAARRNVHALGAR